ncbi:hypothetical protein HORM4_670035 [Vibrio harveyi]|nr:hypothetical protein HORM4_670035 [Vibrio harveyi]
MIFISYVSKMRRKESEGRTKEYGESELRKQTDVTNTKKAPTERSLY